MNNILIKFLIFFSRISIIGTRGVFRKFFISIIRLLSKESGAINLTINHVPFRIFFDTDFKAIFQNYNLKEINFLINNLRKDGAFIDIGANYGYYSQTISFHNCTNKIISVEPNIKFVPRIQENHSLLLAQKKSISPIIVENCAVSDNEDDAFLNLNLGFGSAYLEKTNSSTSIKIVCDTLLNILERHNIKNISGIKIDIEGHEDKALIPFFKKADQNLYPKIILIEYTSSEGWNSDIISFLKELGYNEEFRTKANMALKLSSD